MYPAAGVALIVGGSVLGLLTVFVWWRRLANAPAVAMTVLCGALIGAGGLLVQQDVGVWSWVAAVAICCVLAPVHARFVFGRPGVDR